MEEIKLWKTLEENLKKVNLFYNKMLNEFYERFHILTWQAIQLNLISEFLPFTRGSSTKLERELERLQLHSVIGVSVAKNNDELLKSTIKKQQVDRFIPLDKLSRLESIIEQLKETSPIEHEKSSQHFPSKNKYSAYHATKHNPGAYSDEVEDQECNEQSKLIGRDRHRTHSKPKLPVTSSSTSALHPTSLKQSRISTQALEVGDNLGLTVKQDLRLPKKVATALSKEALHRLQDNNETELSYHQHYPTLKPKKLHHSEPPHEYNLPSTLDSPLANPFVTKLTTPIANTPSMLSDDCSALFLNTNLSPHNTPSRHTHTSKLEHVSESDDDQVDDKPFETFDEQKRLHTYPEEDADDDNDDEEHHLDLSAEQDDFTVDDEHHPHVKTYVNPNLMQIDDNDANHLNSPDALPLDRQTPDKSNLIKPKLHALNETSSRSSRNDGNDEPIKIPLDEYEEGSYLACDHILESQTSLHSSYPLYTPSKRIEINIDRSKMTATMSSPISSHSADSGYDSGGSGEGFVDYGQYPDSIMMMPYNESLINAEATSSRQHHHVPETRLRHNISSELLYLKQSAHSLETHAPSGSPILDKMIVDGKTDTTNDPITNDPSIHALDRSQSPTANQYVSAVSSARSVLSHVASRALNRIMSFKKHDPLSDNSENNIMMQTLHSSQHEDSVVEEADPPYEDAGLNSSIQDQVHENTDSEILDNCSISTTYLGDGDLDLVSDPNSRPTIFEPLPDLKKVNRNRAIEALRETFKELYRGLHLLKSFVELNLETIDKVVAKHEKNIVSGGRLRCHRDMLPKYEFSRPRELKSLITETEHIYACAFTQGHRTVAMQKLRVPKKQANLGRATFRFGFLFGASVALFAIIYYIYSLLGPSKFEKIQSDLIVYRMLAVITYMIWCWGVDMWVWSAYRVNYIFIFNFNARVHLRHQNVFHIVSIFTIVISTSMLIYMIIALQCYAPYYSAWELTWLKHVPLVISPFFLIIVASFIFLFYSIKSKYWLIQCLGRIVTSPLHKVRFQDFFIADQLVSLSIVFQDMDFTLCYFASNAFRDTERQCRTNHIWMLPIISLLPQLWRFLQCLRRFRDQHDRSQLQNAGKYLAGMLVATFSSLRNIFHTSIWFIFWLVTVIIATIYSYAWDVLRDWSLGNRHSNNWMLRDHLLYPKWWYYVAMGTNLVMRLMWTLTISPQMVQTLNLSSDLLITVFACVEISRRAIWNVFRLENEHLSNCVHFRALQDLSLPLPLNPIAEKELFENQI